MRERTSLSLRADVLEAAKEIVQAGQAENLSAFVEDALDEKIRRTRRAALYAAYDKAASDPAFLRDMDDVGKRFSNADTDGL
ncbi:MAG: type II toxin-antitoxin system CcdA family antitoxin [Gemmatimonadaceae bacterium]|nr:type II toxin-antitoxin system CcdA family antitoxin [Gemmatimonadaceae bacterium]